MKIITHDGTFHTDEVFAIALLRKFVKSNFEIVRTRDEFLLDEAKNDKNVFVIDVGREFNFGMKNFDHHQREFSSKWEDGVLYSSCGLIWMYLRKKGYLKKYSKEVLGKIEKKMIKKIDLHDNGKIFWSLSNMVKTCNREVNTVEDFNKSLDLASIFIDNLFQKETTVEKISNIFYTHEVFSLALLKIFFNKDLDFIRTNDNHLIMECEKSKDCLIISKTKDYKIIVKNLNIEQKELYNSWKEGIIYSECGFIWSFLRKGGYLKKYNSRTLRGVENKLIKKIDAHVNHNEVWPMHIVTKICNRKSNKPEDFNKALYLAETYINNMFYQENQASNLKSDFDKDLERYDGGKLFFSSLTNNSSFLKQLSTKTNAEILIYKQLDEDGVDKWYAKSIIKYNTIEKDCYEVFSSLAPESWCGLSNLGLRDVTGFKGGLFVHKTGYLCVAKNKKTITVMANEMLKNKVKIKDSKD